MPIHKTEILGSLIEINYEEKEKNKLIKIIDQFKKRLSGFKELEGKVSDNKIFFLSALKAEDQINDLNNQISKFRDLENINNKESANKVKDINIQASKEIDELQGKLNFLLDKITSLEKNEN